MKRLLLSGLLGLALLPQSSSATEGTYINNGILTFPPQIDATNVINNGTINLVGVPPSGSSTLLPFDTSNTLNFTNTGTMIGSAGFRFDTSPNVGPRRMAANFRNRVTGTITALDSYLATFLFVNGRPIAGSHDIPSYVLVSATNTINEGVLTAGADGTIQLVGTNVNLARGGIQITPILAHGSFNGLFTNYFEPEAGVYDRYWGQSNQVINSSLIIQGGGAVVVSPFSNVQFAGNLVGQARVIFQPSLGGFYEATVGFTNVSITNMMGEVTVTNVPTTNIVQAVFVGLPPNNEFNAAIRFFDSPDPRNPFKTVTVGLQVANTNVVTATPDLASIYVVDTLASETNRLVLTNAVTGNTARPANYLVSRLVPIEFAFGFPGLATFRPDMLYGADFATAIVTNEYAAYSAIIDNKVSQLPIVTNAEFSLLPGRITIVADNLDMSKARFRAEGLTKILAKNLVSSTNALVDGENLSYVLGSTNGTLNAVNLAQESVARLRGTNYMWSGLWTNQQNMVIENYMPDPDDTNSYIPAPITNVVEVRIHAFLLNSPYLSRLPVLVHDFITHSTNVVMNDRIAVVQSLLIDGESLTLNGSITLSNTFFVSPAGNTVVIALNDWVSTNAPNLRHFTNNGTFNIPSEAHFGDDRPLPYTSFINAGTINAGGQDIASSYFENSGILSAAAGGMRIVTPSGKIENGRINSITDVQYFGSVLKLNQATIQTDSRLDLTVTNSLFDAGGSSSNSIMCRDGFRLLIKPQTGDLLGTSIQTTAPAFAALDHVWAGVDRGLTEAGFSNNVALGRLVLTPGNFEDVFPPLFIFSGTGVGNALYVDFLDLSQLADYANELQIAPNLVIYYAAAALGFTPPSTNGVQPQPEEYLDGQFDGRLRWVRDFAGPNSSVDVVTNGKIARANRALRNSLIIDSDGDGIANGWDFFPFDSAPVAKVAMTNEPPLTVLLSWNAVAQKVYQVQSSANPASPNWQTAFYFTNSATTNGIVTVRIPVAAGSARQFYRVGVTLP